MREIEILSEPIVGGGQLVRTPSGLLMVEGVPGARRGLVVESAASHVEGGHDVRGRYRLTRRAVPGTDLWRVRREPPDRVAR